MSIAVLFLVGKLVVNFLVLVDIEYDGSPFIWLVCVVADSYSIDLSDVFNVVSSLLRGVLIPFSLFFLRSSFL